MHASTYYILVSILLAVASPAQGSGPGGRPAVQDVEQKKPEKGGVEQKPAPKPGGRVDAPGAGDVKVPEGAKARPTNGSSPQPDVETQDDDEVVETKKPLPAGTDPADIAAMQSAQAMLKAEARLKKLLRAGKLAGIDRILTFEEISAWPYQDGLKGMPEAVKKMDSHKVMMTGFMLPIDEVENIKEFLLVQSLWSCCYGQPPDINGIVRVVMQGDKRIDYKYDPIKVVGEFKVVASFEEGYCIDIYQLHAESVETIK
jgi:hypothetical protein